MTQKKWHMERTQESVTLSRGLPARFDVSACAEFPLLARGRLAHQIRQDMWRMLQDLRGFSPVVKVEQTETGLTVTAGGQVQAPIAAPVAGRIEAMLNDAAYRARWINCARRRSDRRSA